MLQTKKHIHFIGIGGIGMSSIAKIVRLQGHTVSGCDVNVHQETITQLKSIGCTITQGHNHPSSENTHIDIVVFITAYAYTIPEYTKELEHSKHYAQYVLSRSQMLAIIMQQYTSIGITGSHGKTTTSALLSHILIQAGQDPTVLVGGNIKSINSNARLGNSTLLVAEADESDRSLLDLPATLGLITNIDLEHVETYKDLNDIQETFSLFLNSQTMKHAFLCNDNIHSLEIIPSLTIPFTTFGLSNNADIFATNISLQAEYSTFTITYSKRTYQAHLGIPGIHNIQNALGALAICNYLTIPFEKTIPALASFTGVERRFSFVKKYGEIEIFDDYGHHPEEIKKTLSVARNRSKGKLIVLFQLHKYSRSAVFWNDFINTFAQSDLDLLIITDIYPAFEKAISGINGHSFALELQKQNPSFTIIYTPFEEDFSSITKTLYPFLKEKGLLLTLGAGKMNKLPNYLI